MSIWKAINNSGMNPKVTTKELDISDIVETMAALEADNLRQGRQWVVHTGEGGMKMINDAIQVEAYLQLIKNLDFSKEEKKRLKEMIKSPDPENFVVARSIIDNELEKSRK